MTKNALKIRKATRKDRDTIEVLWEKVIRDAFSKEGIEEHHSTADELAFKMRQFDDACDKAQAHYFLAFDGDKPIGTIAYGTPPNKGILRRTHNALADTMEIGSLYIDPAVQKQSYGKTLLIFILETLLEKEVETVCFDSIIETSKHIWSRLFGEPKYKIPAKNHDFTHMIWVVDVATALENLKRVTRIDPPATD